MSIMRVDEGREKYTRVNEHMCISTDDFFRPVSKVIARRVVFATQGMDAIIRIKGVFAES